MIRTAHRAVLALVLVTFLAPALVSAAALPGDLPGSAFLGPARGEVGCPKLAAPDGGDALTLNREVAGDPDRGPSIDPNG